MFFKTNFQVKSEEIYKEGGRIWPVKLVLLPRFLYAIFIGGTAILGCCGGLLGLVYFFLLEQEGNFISIRKIFFELKGSIGLTLGFLFLFFIAIALIAFLVWAGFVSIFNLIETIRELKRRKNGTVHWGIRLREDRLAIRLMHSLGNPREILIYRVSFISLARKRIQNGEFAPWMYYFTWTERSGKELTMDIEEECIGQNAGLELISLLGSWKKS